MKITIFAHRGEGLGPFFIRLFTGSSVSHVGIYEEVFGSFESVTEQGVINTQIIQYASSEIDLYNIDVTFEQRYKIYEFLKAQKNKKYDWSAVLNIFNFSRDWREDDKWFCSELVAAAFEHAGIPLLHKPAGRVTPYDVICSPLLTKI